MGHRLEPSIKCPSRIAMWTTQTFVHYFFPLNEEISNSSHVSNAEQSLENTSWNSFVFPTLWHGGKVCCAVVTSILSTCKGNRHITDLR